LRDKINGFAVIQIDVAYYTCLDGSASF